MNKQNIAKERCKDLLIVAMLPFLFVLWVTEVQPRLEQWRMNKYLKQRHCDVIHENAPPHLKCGEFNPPPRYFHGD